MIPEAGGCGKRTEECSRWLEKGLESRTQVMKHVGSQLLVGGVLL
jgi:predicted Fe-S protein YdhL (DUF1289 family)